jgi:exo-1,4-beta-D-glucosaminidase
MLGPYDWVPPSYWLTDTDHGGAYGFASEISPGPAIPTLETLQRHFSAGDLDSLWENPGATQLHAGLNTFATLSLFDTALSSRLGPPSSLADWVQKAQVMNYEAERAMFEGYGRNKYTKSTGVIQWMLNNAWPSLIWHLFDYDLDQGGAYFGAKKGNELLHIAYGYNDQSVLVLNHGPQAKSGLKAYVAVYNIDGSVQLSTSMAVDVGADGVAQPYTLPALPNVSPTYFLLLSLRDGGGNLLSSNAYWLSKKAETLDFAHAQWYYTPVSSFADLTGLGGLGAANLAVTAASATSGAGGSVTVTLRNTGNNVAFFVRASLRKSGGDELLPILWSDNYVTLAPGESRTLTARYDVATLAGGKPSLAVAGWNVAAQSLSNF